jgi:hypothetical protein
MAAQHQRQAADRYNEQLPHGAIVAGIGAQLQLDRFWRRTAASGSNLSRFWYYFVRSADRNP